MKPFVISRLFDAPRERVWRAWTDVESLKHWWGPAGFVVTTAKLDLRPGGVFHYGMRAPDGSHMWGRFLFRSIKAPERLEYVNSFSDPEGRVTRAPFSEPWPREMLTTVTFEEEKGKTRVTVTWIPHQASEEEARTFDRGRESMHGGWTGTLGQLEKFLALD